jgi:hypothetical protein
MRFEIDFLLGLTYLSVGGLLWGVVLLAVGRVLQKGWVIFLALLLGFYFINLLLACLDRTCF